jgi:6-phosphogluconolactonase
VKRRVVVLADPAAVAAAAEGEFATALERAVGARGRAGVALSGGSTPLALYRRLARRQDLPWEAVHFFWSDERCVPPTHSESNYGRAREALLARVPVRASHIHRIAGEEDPEDAAAAAAAALAAWGEPLDLVLLGLGADGHTASLFPGSPALRSRRTVVAARSPAGVPWRVTLALPALNASRNVLFLVHGADKSSPLAATLAPGAARTPAARVRPRRGSVVWLVDAAAAAALPIRRH